MTHSKKTLGSSSRTTAPLTHGALGLMEASTEPEVGSVRPKVKPRKISPERWERLKGLVAEVFEAMGMDMDTAGTVHTPERFLKALYESTSGYEGDENLVTMFPAECQGEAHCAYSQVVEGPIAFFALCEHHALPFMGHVHVAYIADENIIGISKLTRLVRVFARRFTVQERMAEEIADSLAELLEPYGVAVKIEATHLCTQMRGVCEEQSRTLTTSWRGSYANDPWMRQEFLQSCAQPSR